MFGIMSDVVAFFSFEIRITPDTAPRDRSYPALTRVGEGWQVYGPYFQPADASAVVDAVRQGVPIPPTPRYD